jgi:ribonuclease P protein component
MLSKANRLPSSVIPEIIAHGIKRRINPSIDCRYVTTPHAVSRFAIVVPKRVYKKAVIRNRVKRIVFESIRHCLSFYTTSCDMTILIHRSLDSDSQHVLEEEIKETLNSILTIG